MPREDKSQLAVNLAIIASALVGLYVTLKLAAVALGLVILAIIASAWLDSCLGKAQPDASTAVSTESR